MGDCAGNVDRTLKVDGLVNGRDLGGLRRADGTVTPRGVFFRSENVDGITGNGWQQLYDAGIRTVVDLRQHGERDADSQERPGWLTTIHVDHDGLANKDFWADYWDNGLVGTALYFLPHLSAMPERTGAALSALVNAPDGGVLFHCMAGRDRTGLISMVLLQAIGTDPECIVDDYLETVRLGDVRASSSKRNNAEPMLEELCRQHGTTTEGAFREALAKFDLQAFLDAAELTDEAREALFTWRGATSTPAALGSSVPNMEDAMLTVREATAEDTATLWDACFEAANWGGDIRFTRDQLMNDPEFSHYVQGWPRKGDFGVVAETRGGDGIGAAWCRTFPADDAGYGFVADDIPELSIGVVPGHRGMGAGTALMEALIDLGRTRGERAISLSVEDGNRARGLYERLGFVRVGRNGGSDTLLLSL